MVVDSSAVLAILLGEPEAERFAATIAEAAQVRIGMVSVLETTAVALGRLRMNSRAGAAVSGRSRDCPLALG